MQSLSSYLEERAVEDAPYEVRSALIWFVILIPIAALLFFQTSFFVRLFERPGAEALRQEAAADRAVQVRLREEYEAEPYMPPLQRGIEPVAFNGWENDWVTEATRLILGNDKLVKEFESKVGVSLKELDAVVIPAWSLTYENCEKRGVEKQAFENARNKSVWRFSVGGFTVRDGVKGDKATKDGRPRIAIHSWSFTTKRTLCRALLHEMFHAANVPSYDPFSLSFAHHDLAYWPEYRRLLELAELNDDCFDNLFQLSDDCLDHVIWITFSIVFALLFRCLWLACTV